MVHGKLFAFPRGDTIVVKLPPDRIAELVDAGRAERTQMGKRLMKEWVELTRTRDWRQLALEAESYVGGLAAQS